MKKSLFGFSVALCALASCAQAEPRDDRARGAEGPDVEAGGVHHAEADSPTLLLAADGLMADGSSESMIAFGANSLDTIEGVTPILGSIYDQDESQECGAGPMEFAMWGPVWLMFQQGEFVGWELREAQEDPWIGTPGGVTIGSPRSDLEAAIEGPVSVEESSLGTEFNGGGFTGLLSSDAPDATVTALWAGTSCVMR